MRDDKAHAIVLSHTAQSFWAKTGRDETRDMWGALTVHLSDTAEVARHVWCDWLAHSTRRFMCESTGMEDEYVESLIAWLAFSHDIGKATPSFQSKVSRLAENVRETGLDLPPRGESISHAILGAAILRDWLEQRGWDEDLVEGYITIVGGHHGTTPNADDIEHVFHRQAVNPDGCLGDKQWREAQFELLDWAFDSSGCSRLTAELRSHGLSPYVQVLLTGIVIMADWISSNTELFPLEESFISEEHSKQRGDVGWDSLRLPQALVINPIPDDANALFHRMFPNVRENATLWPIQEAVVETAREINDPGIIIVEERMGRGKTEAALLASAVLMQKLGCGGIAFLLPTQATSNAMFARAESWLKQLLAMQAYSFPQDLHLLHGKAALNKDFAALPAWGISWMGDAPDDNESVIAHQWFSGAKRGLLAPFVVGTVDQLLMAALNTRHAHLRHLGLVGKVVVIDEVHAYDAYMCVYLYRILEFLGAYHVPVILLSATLPPSKREEFLKAYRGERRINSRRKSTLAPAPRTSTGDMAYPLVTLSACRRSRPPIYKGLAALDHPKRIVVDSINDDDELLVRELEKALVDGGCVCVLRDTVQRAQSTYQLLRKRLEVDVRLVHSRFIALDRAENDRCLTELLGPATNKRPEALVVVGTQVLEQSLDIDVDLLITDIAPIDLLLQRMGRLHRHQRGSGEALRPDRLRTPRCVITGMNSSDGSLPEFARGIDAVYEPSVLMRTLLALQERLDDANCIVLPHDIAPLVEQVYDTSFTVPSTWSQAYENACIREEDTREHKQNSAKQWLLAKPSRYSLMGWMDCRIDMRSEVLGRAAVRDTEESIEVVVVQRSNGCLSLLPWVSDRLGITGSLGTGAEQPDDGVARAAALCTVCLPPTISARHAAMSVIGALERQGVFEGWQESRWLRGALPLVTNERGEAVIVCDEREYYLRYSQEIGLECIEQQVEEKDQLSSVK